jgi:carboxyl-terminal processing protease
MANVFEWVVFPVQPLLPAWLDAALKGTVVLALASLSVLALRRGSAAVRHGIWTLAVVGCLTLPILVPILPYWVVPVPEIWTPEPSTHVAQRLFLTPGSVAEVPSEVKSLAAGNPANASRDDSTNPPTPVASAAVPTVVPAPPIPLWVWLLAAWALGVVMLGLPLLGGCASLRRLRSESHPVMDGAMLTMLAQLVAESGLRRSVTLLQNSRRSMPMTWGWWRPVILLPLEAGSWSPERLRLVLLHELAHVQRWDCLTQVLAYLMRSLYWFHPLAWLAVARLRREQERACDDAVLHSGVSASDYAEELLLLTAGLPASRMMTTLALAMSRSRRIEHRLAGLLDAGRSHTPLTGRLVCRLTVAGLCLLLPLASLRLQTAAAARSNEAAAEAPADQALTPLSIEAKKLQEAQAKILERYVKALNEKEITDAAIRGLLGALNDPYCDYLSPDELAQVERSLGNTFAGIGVQICTANGQPTVVSPLEDSPALEAGLRPGDLILAIDGKATKGITLADVVKRILGPAGSVVKLKIRHPEGDDVEVVVARRQIKVHTVQGFRRDCEDHWDFLLDSERQIGYVRIVHFTSGTEDDVREVLQQLTAKGLKGLILDLRCCPGGLLSAAIESTKLFLAKGTIVTIKGQHDEEVIKADGTSLIGDVPMVVVVNGMTASAGEIVAGALSDNQRAIILGSRSYGKGSVQELIKLEGGSTIRLTTAYYHLPSGRGIHRTEGSKDWGVDPTDGYYVPLTGKQTETFAERRREREMVGTKQAARKNGPLTPREIAKDYADGQLSAALLTMTARLATGTFEKVGQGNDALHVDLASFQREEIRKRRAAALKNLELINKELADFDKKSQRN